MSAGTVDKYRVRLELEVAALREPCPVCEAGSGDWCSTRSGRVASDLHRPRIDSVAVRGAGWRTLYPFP